ncbi:MAG: hypothetical protein FH748_09380 [Balneolaceae bacterium]|nr:hypothetical protein [Balneolaceae bacterium]
MKESTKLGLTLVQNLTNQLKGELEIIREEGVVFQLHFKKRQTKGSSANYFPASDSKHAEA